MNNDADEHNRRAAIYVATVKIAMLNEVRLLSSIPLAVPLINFEFIEAYQWVARLFERPPQPHTDPPDLSKQLSE